MTHGETTPCCEEAALTANELASRNEELSEAQDKIAAKAEALREARGDRADWLNRWTAMKERAEKAEAERDEARAERDEARALADSKLGYPPLDLRHADLTNRAEKAEDDAKWYRDLALKADATIEEAEHERDELQRKLEGAEE